MKINFNVLEIINFNNMTLIFGLYNMVHIFNYIDKNIETVYKSEFVTFLKQANESRNPAKDQ